MYQKSMFFFKKLDFNDMWDIRASQYIQILTFIYILYTIYTTQIYKLLLKINPNV